AWSSCRSPDSERRAVLAKRARRLTPAPDPPDSIIMSDKSWAGVPLGHRIRQLRQDRGWTLAELARRAGTSAPALHRYENGWGRSANPPLLAHDSARGRACTLRSLARGAGRWRAGWWTRGSARVGCWLAVPDSPFRSAIEFRETSPSSVRMRSIPPAWPRSWL